MKLLTRLFTLNSDKLRLALRRFAPWRPDLKVWNHEMGHLIAATRLAVGSMSRTKVMSVALFCKYCSHVLRYEGIKSLVLKLKTMNILLMQSLPGSKIRYSSRAIGKVAVSCTRGGLPRVIPSYDRRLIRLGDKRVIRMWLTLFGLYRVLSFPGKVKLETITSPGLPITEDLQLGFSEFLSGVFVPNLEKLTKRPLISLTPSNTLSQAMPKLILSSGAAAKVGTSSFGSHLWDAYQWMYKNVWGNSLFVYMEEAEGAEPSLIEHLKLSALYAMLHQESDPAPAERLTETDILRVYQKRKDSTWRQWVPGWPGRDCSGRLALKEEAAGKVRVFALVDYWTQCALAPLHKFMFSLLRPIPSDGTFDQHKPIKALLKRVGSDRIIYSYDLSAATDRLPVLFQEMILAVIFNSKFASSWKKLLVGRPYQLPKGVTDQEGSNSVRYAVGQPMGALSSWAMLAITHHALVQYSYFKATGRNDWFKDYAILGDDIVIADCAVARAYKTLLREIGVEIGLAKSLISTNRSAEFAKVLYFDGTPVSGLPLKLFGVAQTSPTVVQQLAASVYSFASDISLASIGLSLGLTQRQASITGTGRWDLMKPTWRSIMVVLLHPQSKTPFSFQSYLGWLLSVGAKSEPLPDTTAPLPVFMDMLISEVLFPFGEILHRKLERVENAIKENGGPGTVHQETMFAARVSPLVVHMDKIERGKLTLAIEQLSDKILMYTDPQFIEGVSRRDSSPSSIIDYVISDILQFIDEVWLDLNADSVNAVSQVTENTASRAGIKTAETWSSMRMHLGVPLRPDNVHMDSIS